MEFNQKLQDLRRQKKLTQEELAAALYVSRTAISRWESGRGYPSIESLKQLSKFFGVTLDELLSGEEILTVAEVDSTQKIQHLRDMVYGLLDCGMAAFLFLPFFGQWVGGELQAVSLLALTEAPGYIKVPYLVIVFGSSLFGLLTLALQNMTAPLWVKAKGRLSLAISAVGALLFMLSQQPYAAMFTFLFLIIKALMVIKWP